LVAGSSPAGVANVYTGGDIGDIEIEAMILA